MINGVVHDKLYLPGLLKLKRLIDSGFFGRILSVRGEFGYWVFEGDLQPAQRPSWNYRAEDGGGMVLDMFCALELRPGEPVRPGRGGDRQGRHPHPGALGRAGPQYAATADDAAYGDLRARGRRHRPDQLVLGGPRRPRRAGRVPGRRHPRLGGRRAVRLPHPAAGAARRSRSGTPTCRRPRTSAASGSRSPTTPSSTTGSGRSGSSSCPTSTPAGHTPTILPPASAACSWPRPACVLGRGPPSRDRPVRRHDHDDRDQLRCPKPSGGWREIELAQPRAWAEHPGAFSSRVAFAAAHVVADPRGENVPGAPAVIDWDATLAFRQHLFRYGLGVAEAMDTAQRNMGLDWAATQELITRSAAQAREHGARIASGAGTDQLLGPVGSLDEVTRAYLEQVEFVEAAGSQVIMMASRQLAATARSAEDYLQVYRRVLTQAARPVILHWLGEMFDPQLSGYWGSTDIPTATRTFLDLINEHTAKVDGVKVSLLSADHEQQLRTALPTVCGSTPATTSTTQS